MKRSKIILCIFNLVISTKSLSIAFSEEGGPNFRTRNIESDTKLDNSVISPRTNTIKIVKYTNSDNQIESVRDLPSLRTIFLENLKQRAIPEFKNVPVLTDIYMQNNELVYVKRGNFGSTNAVYIFLRFNNIFYIEDGSFGPKTKHLYLQCNNLDRFNPKWFQNPSILNVLDLDENNINRLQEGAFKDFKKLEYIYLNGNGLKTIGPNAFSASFISELWLGSNELLSLPDTIFGNTPVVSLERLDISYNKLNYLSEEFLKKVNVLVSLSVDGNPWQCSCYYYHLIPWGGSKISFGESKSGEARCIGENSFSKNCKPGKQIDKEMIEFFYKEISFPKSKNFICSNRIV